MVQAVKCCPSVLGFRIEFRSPKTSIIVQLLYNFDCFEDSLYNCLGAKVGNLDEGIFATTVT